MSEINYFKASPGLVEAYQSASQKNIALKEAAPCNRLTRLLRPYFNRLTQLVQPRDADYAADCVSNALYRGIFTSNAYYTASVWIDPASYVAHEMRGLRKEDRWPIAEQALTELKSVLQNQNSVRLWDSDVLAGKRPSCFTA